LKQGKVARENLSVIDYGNGRLYREEWCSRVKPNVKKNVYLFQ